MAHTGVRTAELQEGLAKGIGEDNRDSHTHRIQLDPTEVQKRYFINACGVSRFTYNWALAEWKQQYASGLKPSAFALKKQFNAIRATEFPWSKEVHRDATSQPFANLGKAFSCFFKGGTKYPQFKCKGKCRNSFYVANDVMKVDGKRVRLPIIGWVKLTEDLRFGRKDFKATHPNRTYRIMSATVSRTADRWFISINVLFDKPLTRTRTVDGIVGVDVGLTTLATLSTGEPIPGPKALKHAQKKLKRLGRALSQKVKGSNNRTKAKMKLARQHRKVANQRRDALHKLTTRLCRENQAVGIEGLHVKGMMKNHCLAAALSDAAFGEFKRQMGYKTPMFGTRLVVADKWFPSTKRCSRCTLVKPKMGLSARTFRCLACGLALGRDHNAALNLRQLCTVGYTGTGGGNTLDAWGVSSVGGTISNNRSTRQDTSNQEPGKSFHVLPHSG